MKYRAISMAAIVGSALCCFGIPAMGQQLVSVQFTGGYSTTFANTDGDFGAGIYTGTVNGATTPGIICDDYRDEVTSGETWNANAYQASSLASGNLGSTLFGNAIGLDGYAEIATLVSMMFGGTSTYSNGGTTITGITQAELSSAIWYITTPGGINGLDANAALLVSTVEAAFGTDTAKAKAYLANLTNLWILTPNPLTGIGNGEPQEMWTENLSVPEGGAALMYLLLAGLTCFGAMLFSRKQEANRIAL